MVISHSPIQADADPDIWGPLIHLQGQWKAEDNESTVYQEFRFIMNGKFLLMKTKGIFKPTEKRPEGEIHEDMGVFSYDEERKTHLLRAFYSEGFVNQYTLENDPEGKSSLTFLSENIENAPLGTRAKLVIEFKQQGEMEQSFFVAWPDKEFSCFSMRRFKKF
jgi:hypothetical protein